MKPPEFYCKNYCVDPEFSIAEWNREYEILNALEIEMPESETCEVQCVDCACIVGKRRIETKELIEN